MEKRPQWDDYPQPVHVDPSVKERALYAPTQHCQAILKNRQSFAMEKRSLFSIAMRQYPTYMIC